MLFFICLFFTLSYATVIRNEEVSLTNYPKVARWGSVAEPLTPLTSSNVSDREKENKNDSWNQRVVANSRKMNYVTNNMGITYYYSKDIPRVDENSESMPGTGEVFQEPYNHKPYYDFVHKPNTYSNSEVHVSQDIKPPTVVYGTPADYSKNTNSKSLSSLYNSPYTSYNPPSQQPSISEDDFVEYPPFSSKDKSKTDKNGNNNNENGNRPTTAPPPQPQISYPKIPLTELYSSMNSPEFESEADSDLGSAEPTEDSYNTPKPPKGSKPKPPVPVYGPPPPPQSSSSGSPSNSGSAMFEKPKKKPSSDSNVYSFPEPFPVPQVHVPNGHSPPATSYGVPVSSDYFDSSAFKQPKGSMKKKKPTKPVENQQPKNEPSPDDDKKSTSNKYPSAPRPFHPPLVVPDEDDGNDQEHHHNGGSFLAPPPLDDDDGSSDEDTPPDYYSKPMKPTSKKPSSNGKHPYPSSNMEDSKDSPLPMNGMSSHYPHDYPMDDMKGSQENMNEMDMKYPPRGPSMAEDDLSPPPSGEEQYGHQFHYGPYDYDHHIYHEIKTTTTTAAPPKHRAYSYYYLGRKLWYVPLYFSIYFIVYVTILIIKSIARHKVDFANNYFDYTTHSSRMFRELHDVNETHANVAFNIENATSKYM